MKSNGICEHFLITRFNVEMPWTPYIADSSWCKERVDVFEQLCIPSIEHQTNKQFHWLVFFDKNRTSKFLDERIERWYSEIEQFEAVFVSLFVPNEISKKIATMVRDRTPHRVITSRLDSDDLISSDYILSLSNVCEMLPSFQGFINFDNGFCIDNNRIYTVKSEHNAFCSYIDTYQRDIMLKTCHHFNHNRIHDSAPVYHIDTGVWFAYLNHENNISTKKYGRTAITDPHVQWRVGPHQFVKTFPWIENNYDSARVGILRENFVRFAKHVYGSLKRSASI